MPNANGMPTCNSLRPKITRPRLITRATAGAAVGRYDPSKPGGNNGTPPRIMLLAILDMLVNCMMRVRGSGYARTKRVEMVATYEISTFAEGNRIQRSHVSNLYPGD